MTARQAWAKWAALWVAAILAAQGCSSKPGPSQGNSGPAAKKEASAVAPGSPAEPPKELTFDLGDGVAMKLILIPAGKFVMGEGDDQHEVTLSKPFYMGVTTVTQAQYRAIMGTSPSRFEGKANPMDTVSWNDAVEFCKQLSEKARRTVRLPTEAEWEYACRAGTKTRFSFGDDQADLGDYGWYMDNAGDTTHPVGQKKPNPWGLYDMHGNILEWCSDWCAVYAEGPATDPTGPATGDAHMLRGGGWSYDAQHCRAAFRFWDLPDHSGYVGFRVVAAASAPGN
jgi:formylglycine-generating enzyme required for sulfatase activity